MVYICVPYYNEELITRVQIQEDIKWADQLHICESDYTFKYGHKGYLFPNELSKQPFVHYHKLKGKNGFLPNNYFGKILLAPRRFSRDSYLKLIANPSWHNESVQRNIATQYIKPNDDDFVVLSDVDEIIDPRYVDQLLTTAKEKGIVTCKLHFTMFYFNLFVKNWGGPADYSYRLFVMTGKFFNEMTYSSDRLRKMGEHHHLYDNVHCIDQFCGFHHSWLGDAEFVQQKLHAYAHSTGEHISDYQEFIEDCIKQGKPIFSGAEFYTDNTIELLSSVESLRTTEPTLFWEG